jgi:hypothetical protein
MHAIKATNDLAQTPVEIGQVQADSAGNFEFEDVLPNPIPARKFYSAVAL